MFQYSSYFIQKQNEHDCFVYLHSFLNIVLKHSFENSRAVYTQGMRSFLVIASYPELTRILCVVWRLFSISSWFTVVTITCQSPLRGISDNASGITGYHFGNSVFLVTVGLWKMVKCYLWISVMFFVIYPVIQITGLLDQFNTLIEHN